MATNKRVFTLRLSDEVFDKIGILATKEHRSMTNYIEYVLMKHLEQTEKEHGEIETGKTEQKWCFQLKMTSHSYSGWLFYTLITWYR